MKTLPAMIAASLLIASVSATAATDYETITTPVAATKAQAYDQGVNKLSALQGSSPAELERSLDTAFGDIEMDSLRLKDGGFVTVQERANANGSIGYVGIVNVGVDYEMHDSDE